MTNYIECLLGIFLNVINIMTMDISRKLSDSMATKAFNVTNHVIDQLQSLYLSYGRLINFLIFIKSLRYNKSELLEICLLMKLENL